MFNAEFSQRSLRLVQDLIVVFGHHQVRGGKGFYPIGGPHMQVMHHHHAGQLLQSTFNIMQVKVTRYAL